MARRSFRVNHFKSHTMSAPAAVHQRPELRRQATRRLTWCAPLLSALAADPRRSAWQGPVPHAGGRAPVSCRLCVSLGSRPAHPPTLPVCPRKRSSSCRRAAANPICTAQFSAGETAANRWLASSRNNRIPGTVKLRGAVLGLSRILDG